jgi:hypothetical protein
VCRNVEQVRTRTGESEEAPASSLEVSIEWFKKDTAG